AVPGGAAAAAGTAVAQLIGTAAAQLPAEFVHLASYQVWLLGLPFVAGLVIRLWRESVQRDREETDRRLAYEERLQVAREVHDVVGHGLAVINLQAGGGLHVPGRPPPHDPQAPHA